MNTLIVDDDPNARKTFGEILKTNGFEVEEAATGSEAVRSCEAKFFNLVLIDVRLPDISGLEVLQAVHALHEESVLIMITSYASLDSSLEAMNKGAFSYFTKPVNIDAALVVITKGLEKQRLSLENKRLLKELAEANKKLEELDKRKSYFVSNVSHEFKNPLAVIRESMKLLLDDLAGKVNPDQKEILEMGKRNAERLMRLASDLLDLQKIEAGMMVLRKEKIAVDALVGEVIQNFEIELFKKRLHLQKEIQANGGCLFGDRDKLTQVFINLLSNAIKYTPEGGNIVVKLEGNEKEIRFEIADSGQGIPEGQREMIFNKYTRLMTEKQEGTGLGLAIVKEIVELHKGWVWVESEPGKGSRFIFTMPKEASPIPLSI